MKRYICIHGHFYQPPRENPWLEEVELQDTAAPFHDWNQRITAECYGPNTCSRILDHGGRILDIVNNYARISFNFGPTLLSWLQRHQPEVYGAILEADRQSRERFSGHGSALAQVYNHMIMPLANERDKRTQLLWGLEDFRRRFDREAEGLWLPETAVDLETLDLAAELGILFTILAPRQAARIRRLDKNALWQDVSDSRVDPTTPYRCSLPSGRSIALFFYDGPISQDLAFGDMLQRGESFHNRLMAAFTDNGRPWPQLVHVATDGETYGHHHTHGEMALSWAIRLIEEDPEVELTNYGEYLELHPPRWEAEIFENSSWSCIHGVERWRADCGCNSGLRSGWNQAWRRPLREGVTRLGQRLDTIFGDQGARYFKDPWLARDHYAALLLDRSASAVSAYLERHARLALTPQESVQALKFLEMQRFGQLTQTSCAWFFDEITGIEAVQIMQYAVRAIQLAEELSGEYLEDEFLGFLDQAKSNLGGTGAEAYRKFAKPAKVDLLRVAAHYAITSLFEEYPHEYDFAQYSVVSDIYHRVQAGRSRLCTGKARMTSQVTREYSVFQFAVLHPGDHNLSCGVTFFRDLESYRGMERELATAFEHGNIAESIRLMNEHFGKNIFSVQHLFRDAQRRVVGEVLEPAFSLAEASYRQIYESNYTILNFLEHLRIPPPSHFLDAARHVVNTDLKRLFDHDEIDIQALDTLLGEARKWNLQLELETLGFKAAGWVNRRVQDLARLPEDLLLAESLQRVLEHLQPLPLGLHIWSAQNTFFRLWKELSPALQEQVAAGGSLARQRLDCLTALGELLRVRPS